MKKFVNLSLIFVLILTCAIPTHASKLSQYKSQKNSLSNKINSISKGKKSVKAKIANTTEQKNALNNQKDKKQDELSKINNELKEIEVEVGDINKALQDAQQNFNNQKEILKNRLKILYESGDATYFKMLMEATSLSDLYERAHIISLIAENDRKTLESYQQAKKELEYKKSVQQAQMRQKALEAENKKTSLNKILNSRAETDAQLQKLKREYTELQAQEESFRRQSNIISQRIRNLQSSHGSYSGGRMLWPTPSCTIITSPYGMRLHPILHKYSMHTGIDIGARKGASIIAAKSGTVILAGWNGPYGYSVIIDHGGKISTLYGHCSKLLVHVGQNVRTGQTIAKVGSTGNSTGPHLHFEVRVNGNYTNPFNWVRR